MPIPLGQSALSPSPPCGIKMNLELPLTVAEKYKSRSQIARVVTEQWAALNLYCPACDSNRILQERPNKSAIDFTCPKCNQPFQLKGSRTWNYAKIVDAGYQAMLAAIHSDTRPSLFLLHYTPSWQVHNLLLVPRFFLTESVIEKRRPLSLHARRAGWVGCNILLSEIPTDGKLWLVSNGVEATISEVRAQFQRIQPFAHLDVHLRGWTLDMLKVIRKMNRQTFSLSEIYVFESELARTHPDNRNIRPKIRQQLQVLRDLGFLEFTKRGYYRIRW